MTRNKAVNTQVRPGISIPDAIERIINARKRALSHGEPCYTEQSLRDKVIELSRRLADLNDLTARDDTVFFLSCRQPALSTYAQIHLELELKQRDTWELERRSRTLRLIKS